MNTSYSPNLISTAEASTSPTLHRTSQAESFRPCAPQHDVGAVPQHQVEAELDQVIRELGDKAVQALANEDPTGARILTSRMYAAIASRTPEHQARLAAEVEQRITEGVDYFAHQGQLDRERLGRNA